MKKGYDKGLKPFYPLLILLLSCLSCAEYSPKPRGYVRIEPPSAQYTDLTVNDLPYSFRVSLHSTVELPPENDTLNWINISYPTLGAKVYCNFLSIDTASLAEAEAESRLLVSRQSQRADVITEKEYTDPEQQVYATLFLLDGESVAPVQFMLTDRYSRFFRGALYYDRKPNADSLAPVTDYLQKDIIELIQSFNWKD